MTQPVIHRPSLEVLRVLIQDSGHTYKDLQSRSGVNQAVISRFVRGKRSIRADTAFRIMDALGVNICHDGRRSA